MRTIDINADVGEGCGFDAPLMHSITSANVCAGFHAGGPAQTAQAVRLAHVHDVAIGVHPGFRDREGFGRRELAIGLAEIEALVAEQIAIVAGAAAAQHARVHHVKPHGALYNMAARDRSIGDAIVRAIAAAGRDLILYAPPGSQLLRAGEAAGLRVAAEVFADRSYAADGSLVPRSAPAAVVDDVDVVIARAVRLAAEGSVRTIDGSELHLRADTICVHGDTMGSDVLAARLRSAFEREGVEVRAVSPQ